MDKELHDLDAGIIDLISERFSLLIEALREKGAGPGDLFSPAERARLFDFIDERNRGPFSGDVLKKVYTELMSHALDLVQPVRVAYLGPAGTFSHSAMLEVFGESVKGTPVRSIRDVFMETESGRTAFGVVPIENSTEGAVTYSMDEMLESDLLIVAEKYLRVSYSLISVNSDRTKIKKIYSHPQSLAQCKEWLRNNLPDVEVHSVSSTSLAAEAASWDKFSGAIASEASAAIYKLNVLTTNIEDSKQNYTRFFVIGDRKTPPTGRDKTSIVCAIKDKPGALYNVLKPFSDSRINMTRIESRPDKKKMWEYNFFIDFTGHRDDIVVADAIEKMKEELLFLKVLGSYPAEK